jgi:hypothetical protein
MKAAPGLMVLAVLGAASVAHAANGCRDATEFAPRLCPSVVPAVRSVVVTRNGQASSTQEQPWSDCARFKLTPRLVRRYFSRAWVVADPRGESAVERGPCEAEGNLRLADGRTGHWRIEQVGTATLLLSSGGAPITLLCTQCSFAPFRR